MTENCKVKKQDYRRGSQKYLDIMRFRCKEVNFEAAYDVAKSLKSFVKIYLSKFMIFTYELKIDLIMFESHHFKLFVASLIHFTQFDFLTYDTYLTISLFSCWTFLTFDLLLKSAQPLHRATFAVFSFWLNPRTTQITKARCTL